MTVDSIIKSGNIQAIRSLMAERGLRLDGDKLVPIDDERKASIKALGQLNDSRQLAKKILL